MGKKQKQKQREKLLKRRHKTMIHMMIIGIIAVSLLLEGGKLADWLFVGLGVVVEWV